MSFTEADVSLSELHVDPENNTREDYGDIDELKTRIKALGLWGRIHVSEVVDEGDGKKYTLENGFRRVRAVSELVSEGVTHSKTGQDLRTLKAQVLDGSMTDTERAELMLAINTSQKAWTPYEQAKEIEYLLQNGIDLPDIQERLGLKELAVKQRLALLSAPDFLQDALAKNEVSATHARAILRVPNEDMQKELTQKAVSEDLATREIETLAETMVEKAVEQGAPEPRRKRKKKDEGAVSVPKTPTLPVRPAEEIIAEMEAYQAAMLDADEVTKVELEAYVAALSWTLYDADISPAAEDTADADDVDESEEEADLDDDDATEAAS